ncbi:MAG: hypothetical protein IAC08_07230 [Bacteroidetes bacterium]|uniref:Lipoprotein n=1 Tax=Candidatus Cryptobacteroides intestinigallinarum TaxID=2840767 RepID=A0A9D9HLR9_9BACT|nr:hypothetical protein [Candidatus Cryptobacteroides intestinigallinarum]
MKTMTLAGITAAVLLIAGCVRNNFSETDFQVVEGISLYVKGQQILSYTPEKCQIGFNPDSGEIRVSDDDMADYFIIRFTGSIPANEGEVTKADIEYTTPDNLKRLNGISFRVTRTDEDSGLIWLWDEAGKTGVVLPDMKRLE